MRSNKRPGSNEQMVESLKRENRYMTIETKATIQLGDVKSIEFECKNCHCLMTWPIETARQPPSECCGCGVQFMNASDGSFRRLMELLSMIKDFSAAKSLPFALRLCIEGLAEKR